MTTDLVEKCARALWQRESERAALCDDVLSSVRGQAIKPTMDPFDAHRDMWIGDALAVIDALADGVTPEMAKAAWTVLGLAANPQYWPSTHGKWDEVWCGNVVAAAIRAAKTREG